MTVKTVKVSDKEQTTISSKIKGNELFLEDDFSDLLKLSEKSLIALWDNEADAVWDSL